MRHIRLYNSFTENSSIVESQKIQLDTEIPASDLNSEILSVIKNEIGVQQNNEIPKEKILEEQKKNKITPTGKMDIATLLCLSKGKNPGNGKMKLDSKNSISEKNNILTYKKYYLKESEKKTTGVDIRKILNVTLKERILKQVNLTFQKEIPEFEKKLTILEIYEIVLKFKPKIVLKNYNLDDVANQDNNVNVKGSFDLKFSSEIEGPAGIFSRYIDLNSNITLPITIGDNNLKIQTPTINKLNTNWIDGVIGWILYDNKYLHFFHTGLNINLKFPLSVQNILNSHFVPITYDYSTLSQDKFKNI